MKSVIFVNPKNFSGYQMLEESSNTFFGDFTVEYIKFLRFDPVLNIRNLCMRSTSNIVYSCNGAIEIILELNEIR
jgi:hypothetical protein